MPYSNSRSSKPRQSISKKPWLALLLLVILLGAGFLYVHHHNNEKKVAAAQTAAKKASTVHYSAAPAADNTANDARKTSTTPAPTLDNGSTASTPATFSVAIANASTSNGYLHVGNEVTGTTTGSCTLTASQAGQATLQLATSSVRQDVNTYDCGVFGNVPTSKFPTKGSWKLTLTVTNGGVSASDNMPITIT